METLLLHIRSQKVRYWDYEALSRNPHLTWDLMQKNSDLPWNHSANPNVTEEIIQQNPQINWRYSFLSLNQNLSVDFFLAQKWHHPVISWPRVLRNARFTFSEEWFGRMNACVPLDDFDTIYNLSQNTCLQLSQIQPNSLVKWNRASLSLNPNLTLEYVLSNPSFLKGEWNWSYLTVHPNITYAQIKAHPDLPWVRSEIHQNPSITEAEVPELSNHSGRLIENANISLAFIQRNRHLNWSLIQLEENRSLRLEQLLLPSTQAMGIWNWSILLTHIRGALCPEQLQVLHQERRNPASYWSLLPPDMLQHYLARFFD